MRNLCAGTGSEDEFRQDKRRKDRNKILTVRIEEDPVGDRQDYNTVVREGCAKMKSVRL